MKSVHALDGVESCITLQELFFFKNSLLYGKVNMVLDQMQTIFVTGSYNGGYAKKWNSVQMTFLFTMATL